MADEVAEAPPQQGDPKLTVDQFAAKIKAKYPEYAQIDNATLTDKILAKYPEYGNHVTLPSIVPKSTIPTFNEPSNIPYTPQYADAHQQAIQTAKEQKAAAQPKEKPQKEERGILDQVGQAMYLPAFNQGFNELVTKPLAGANDFVDRTIDKVYTGITGQQTPDWLRKGSGLDNIVKYYDDAYQGRDKPKNIVSDITEGAVGTIPLMASMFTGEGEASLAAKALQFISKATKILGITGAANAYKDATDNGEDYGTSLKEAAKGEIKGNVQGLTIDAQMLVGNAFGKRVGDILAEKGLKFGGKAGDAILHAIATGTVFSGTSAGSDLLQGKDIDTHEAMKQFGMGLMFEIPTVAKAMSEHLEGKRVNENAAKLATASTAISNMNAESTLRTLMNTPSDKLAEINDNVKQGHDELYANSIEQGAKAYEAEDLGAKNNHYINQMLLKTQADVKLIADKVADPEQRSQLVESITQSDELPPEQKQDLLDKIAVLTPKDELPKQAEPITENGIPEAPEEIVPEKVNEEPTNNNLKTENNEKSGEQQNRQESGQETGSKEEAIPAEEKVSTGAENAPLQKAVDAVTHGIVVPENIMGRDPSARFDFGMDTRDKQKAVRDIKNGNYETEPAKKMLAKLQEWDKNDEYPIVEGLGGGAKRTKFATGEEIQSNIDEAKASKLGELTPEQIKEVNKPLSELGFTHKDFEDYENHRAEHESNNGRPVEGVTDHVQQPENDQVSGAAQDTGSEATQGSEPKGGINEPEGFGPVISEKRNGINFDGRTISVDPVTREKLPFGKGFAFGDVSKDNFRNTGFREILKEKLNEHGVVYTLTGASDDVIRVAKKIMGSDIEAKEFKIGDNTYTALINKQNEPAKNNEALPAADSGNTKKEAKGRPESQVSEVPKETGGKVASLSDAETKRKLELRKKFSGQLNDITRIPTLLADKEFREYAGLVLKETAGDFKQFSKELIDHVGEKIREHLPKLFKDLGGDEKQVPSEHKDEEIKTVYGTKNSVTEALRDGMGMPPVEIPKDRSEDASLNAWKEGTRTPLDIIGDLLDPKTDIYDKSITPNDEPIMREYIKGLGEQGAELNKVKAHLEAEGGSPEDIASVTQQLANHYDQMERALNASKIGGNIWHKYGAERQLAIDDKGLVLNSIERIKNIYGTDIPAEVKKELNELQAKYDNLLAKNANIEAKLKAKGAEDAFEKAKPKKTIFGTKKKTDVEFKKERADIVEQMKRDLKKSLGQLNASIPGIPQLNAISPHVAKLIRSFAEQGTVKLDEAIDKVHDIVKDVVDGISKNDIRDIMAGRYSDKKPLSELQKQVADLRTQARNQLKIQDLEKGIATETKRRGEASPEVKALQKQVADLKKTMPNEHADLSIADLKTQIRTIQTKIDKGDFFKIPTVKRQWETNPEWVKNNKEKGALNFRLRKLEREAMDSKKSKLMRGEDWFNRWGRRIIFFGANSVYTKLASAAVLGSFTHKIIEHGLGKVNAKMFPHLASKAPIEGNQNMASLGKFYSEFTSPTKLGKNTWSILKSGETDLSRELGKQLPHHHIPFVDLFSTDLHIAIKDPVKRAVFESSLINHLNWYEQNGIDPTHPLMLESARQAAYKRAEYEIFQNTDNRGIKLNNTTYSINRFFNELESNGIVKRNEGTPLSKLTGNAQYTVAQLYHFFIPVNTVPVNILKRVGLGLKLPFTVIKAMANNKAVKEGFSNMTGEEADAIMLQLKKGQIQAAYWTLGFVLAGSAAGGLYNKFYSDKDREKTIDPNSDYLNLGTDIPKDVQHTPQLVGLQMGATWGIVRSHYVDDNGEGQIKSILMGGVAETDVALKQHPVIETTRKMLEAIETPHGNTKFVKDLKQRVGYMKALKVLDAMGYPVSDDTP